jgi:DNA-binding response OmpR family regulator
MMAMELDVRADALGGRRTKRLFEVLLAADGAVVSTTRLAQELWGDEPPRDVDATLHTYVTVLRNRLEPGVPVGQSVVVSEPDGFRFTLADRRRYAHAV